MDITPEMEDGIVSALADKCDQYKARTGRSPLDLATAEQQSAVDAARIRHHERRRTGTLPIRSTPDAKESTTMGYADDASAALQQVVTNIHERAVPQIIAGKNLLTESIGLLRAAGSAYVDQWGGYLSQLAQNVEQAAGQANDLSNEIEGEAARLRQSPR